MTIVDFTFSKIKLVDGEFYQELNNGTKIQLFLYKYKRKESYLTQEDVFNTPFDYDLVVFDENNNVYLYFTYAYKDDANEVF